MPTFTALAFDRLIESGAARSMAPATNSPEARLERRNSTPDSSHNRRINAPVSRLERGVSVPPGPKVERGVSLPPKAKQEKGVNIPSDPRLSKRNGASAASKPVVDKNSHWTQISPALYATPASTPLPDSPSSFPPSPYIINHKRRGPRLMKSFSEDEFAACKQATDEVKVDENRHAVENEVASVSQDCAPKEVVDSSVDDDVKSSAPGDDDKKYCNGVCDEERGSSDMENGSAGRNGVMKSVAFNLQQDSRLDEFVDPQDSMSVMSIGESECNVGGERSLNSTKPMAEFYDAWEELSAESGPQLQTPDIETELREIRLSLLMEIEKRKQAEENLNNMRSQWQRIREQLSLVGLTLPEDPTTLPEGEQSADPAADMCQQVYLARFVSNSIGRGIAKAEVEMEMEAQLKLKNSEIARLWDRLHYYEAVNQEMSQRNQEVVETARRLRQRRKRRQRWIWGSIATATALGSAVLAYSYFQTGKGSSSPSSSRGPEIDRKGN